MSEELEKHINEIENFGIKKEVFKTPENYFDNLEEQLFAKISEDNLPKETGFSVPNNYFATTEEKIVASIPKKNKTRIIPIKLSATVATIAAMFVLYFGVSRYMTEDKITFDTLTENDLNNWVSAGNIEMDEYTIAGIVSVSKVTDEMEGLNFTDSELIEYLDVSAPEILYLEE